MKPIHIEANFFCQFVNSFGRNPFEVFLQFPVIIEEFPLVMCGQGGLGDNVSK
jgi:hypothetical protein